MVIFLFDHRPGMRNMLGQLSKAHVESLCQQLGATCNNTKMSEADLVLGHFRYEQIEQIVHNQGGAANFTDKQIVVFISAALEGYSIEEPSINRIVEIEGKRRALLFVRRMKLLTNEAVLKGVLNLSFEQAEKIVTEGNAASLDWDEDPFSFAQLPVFEVLPALSILCQAYLAQLAAVQEPKREEPKPPSTSGEVKTYSGWIWPKTAVAPGDHSEEQNVDGPTEEQSAYGAAPLEHERKEEQPDEPKWWQVFAGLAPVAEARREWNSLEVQTKNGTPYGWIEVQTLLNAIQSEQTNRITPAMVAEAYAAIVQRFG